MSRLGRFELLAPLGSGGVAEVWRARDTVSGGEVALKRLLPQFADDRQVRRRFSREAEVARRLDHPNIVRAVDSGEEEGQPFLAMELVGGEDLGRRLDREGRLAAADSWRIALAVARALAHAHGRGVIHRDVKPQNVLLDGDKVKLTDFGLARVETLASLTGSSLLWGSPEYMAPELFGRGRIDPRTDLYSLGVLMHEMVTGRLPWKEGRSPARIAAALADAPPVAVALGQGDALDRLVSALLSASPDDRPASAAEVIAMLEGERSVAPVVQATTCTACGRPRPEDIPRCFSCGHDDVPLRHVSAGNWNVVLTKIRDDAGSMASLHRVLEQLTGRPASDLKLKFLLGYIQLYSSAEKKDAIKLPARLFADLDRATAKEIESRFKAAGLQVQAAKAGWLGIWTRQQSKLALILGGGMSAWIVASQFLMHTRHHLHHLFLASAMMAVVVVVSAAAVPARWLARQQSRFRLRPATASTPVAERLLGAAQQAGSGLAAPEVRALFVEASRELYRLTRRAEELAGRGPAKSSEGALAGRLLAAAPALGARVESLARRLETLDAALEGDGEGDFARALAALERRLAGAAESERPALNAALRDLEAALERRLVAEVERERLAASLCALLGTVRDVYRRAASIETVEEREAVAIEAALRELDALPAS